MLKKWSYPLLQIIVIHLIAIALPLSAYLYFAEKSLPFVGDLYIIVVCFMFITSLLIWAETILAIKETEIKKETDSYPLATAIIAAYLPNEKDTILKTLDSFFNLDYPLPIQIILAYNSPKRLHIEGELYELSKKHPNLELLKVYNSHSKAENVNAALKYADGEFVGVFDADHNPKSDSFKRAWQWLSNGYDVVQGRCVISNVQYSWLTKLVAIEFEIMYGLNHVGRNRLHGFGIFGGSNGYWKTELLKNTEMHSNMMTEDIDSSLRIVSDGFKIASDPNLISLELAPVNLYALWNQRMRWAQGWFQVSVKHHKRAIFSKNLSLRQRIGMAHLLIWRELFPWIAIQLIPLLLFWMIYDHGAHFNLLIPIYLFTTLFSLSSSVGQIYVARKLATEDIKNKGIWFIYYFIASFFLYSRMKDIIAMIAHVQELLGQRVWKVTPRITDAETHSLAL